MAYTVQLKDVRQNNYFQGTSNYGTDLYNILDHSGDEDDMCKRF